MALAKGHALKTKSQVSYIRTIGPLVFAFYLIYSNLLFQYVRDVLMIVKLHTALRVAIFCGVGISF